MPNFQFNSTHVVTKKELCTIFACTPYLLRTRYFTPAVLTLLNIPPDEFSRLKTFTFDQTKRILQHFDIDANERITPKKKQ
jgi:hypothetical protein